MRAQDLCQEELMCLYHLLKRTQEDTESNIGSVGSGTRNTEAFGGNSAGVQRVHETQI
jgi:hypothetical protein